MTRWLKMIVSTAIIGFTVSACAAGPATKADVCAEFDTLGERYAEATGILDNAVFSQADDLADAASL